MNMRSIKNRLLLKGRKNKQTIITNSRAWLAYPLPFLLALAIVVGTSNALDFCIDHKDVAIAVNKNIAGNDIPNEVTAVGETPLTIHFLETDGGHVGVDGYLRRGLGILYKILLQNGHNSSTVESRKGMELIVSFREYLIVHPDFVKETKNTTAI